MSKSAGKRLEFLDGIRGFTAITVVLNHFAVVYYPDYLLSQHTDSLAGWLSAWKQLPLMIATNGVTAVQYFFVLTGFLVARSLLPGTAWRQEQLLQKSVNRYLRLLPMVAGATIFTYFTMVLGLQFHQQAAHKLPYPESVMSYCDFSPTLPFLVSTVFFRTFMEVSLFVSPFWTIRYELWGYLLCMLGCYVLRDSKLRRLGYVAVLMLVWTQLGEYYVSFFLGVLTADMALCNDRDTTVLSRFYHRVFNHPAVLGLLMLAGFVLTWLPVYQGWSDAVARALGISMLLLGLMRFPRLAHVVEGRILQWLGKASFGIYAFHWPLMLTVEPKLFDILSEFLSYDAAAWCAFVLTLPVILAVGWGAWWLFEKKCRWDIGPLLYKLHT